MGGMWLFYCLDSVVFGECDCRVSLHRKLWGRFNWFDFQVMAL